MSVAGNGAPGSGAPEYAAKQKESGTNVMDGSSSSKVTVEYHDPSGLFPLVQDQLTARFPLRNLHWKAPNRPLRSIDSLHVELVPSKDSVHISGVTSPGLAPPDNAQSLNASNRPSGSGEHIRPPSKERRHQIPGLRQTPYLKIYLLRCDDSDTYKSTARKQLREWVKAHTPPSQSSSSASTQENHDAFEWLILHVVVPNTPAASQPRGSATSSTTTGEKEKSGPTSRWTRGTTTILEKIRADFNVSSKNAPDRVAQVRLEKQNIPPHMLPATSSVTSPPVTESPQEQERAWGDLIVKFKSLILMSFDLRVSQYEEDIREKESQRALPGWNFCTFFMLKEGLAKGFESVGLVEDALLGYDELSVGLDTVLRDQANEGSETQGGVILDHSKDLHQRAAEILKRSQKDDGGRKEPVPHIHDAKPINSRKKNYRDLILANDISIFDFRCYIFSRQMSLLLRLGNAHSARSDLASKLQPRPSVNRSVSVDDASPSAKSGDDREDLLALAELCSRALNFLTFAGRLLREDLLNGAKAQESTFPIHLVDNLVRSWTYAAVQQVLEETTTSSLPISKFLKDDSTGSSEKMQSFGNHAREQKLSFAEPKTMIHPSRSSSLNHGRPASADAPYSRTPPTGQVIYDNGQYHERPSPGQEISTTQGKTGVQELAGTRAQLLVVQRRVLEQVGKSSGWSIGWGAILATAAQKSDLTEVNLDDESESDGNNATNGKHTKTPSATTGLSAAAIVNAISSLDQFRQAYEFLSDLIVKHYMAAGQENSGQTVLGDLAALRYELGDFVAASMYFGRMASTFAERRWNIVESTMLRMHAECLKKLNRKDEYVDTLLTLLAKSAANKKSFQTPSKKGIPSVSGPSINWLDDDQVDTAGVLSELVAFSPQLPKDKMVAMNHFFSDISVEPYVRHYDEKDGFQLRLQFRHLVDDEITLDQARIRLVSVTSSQAKEIWLENAEPVTLKKGICRIWLGSNVNTNGPYMVDTILIGAKHIVFQHEPFTKAEATTPLGITTSVSAASLKATKKARILCFPRSEAFQAKAYLSHFIHIDKQRSIEIKCSSGWNDIQSADIRLRSASAGLRLRTADAKTVTGNVDIDKQSKPNAGVITIGSMAPEITAIFRIPYDLEMVLPDLTVKVEIEYTTEKGRFQFHETFTISIELPLDVNVHDHFKSEAVFSKFNIKTANHVPLEVLDVGLEGSEDYDVHSPRRPKGPVMVFPKQPVAITYQVTRKAGDMAKRRQSRPNIGSLSLSVVYRCLDEDVLDRVRELFTAAVEKSPVHRLARLLIATFIDRMQHRVITHQFEKIALLGKIDLGSFDGMGWEECLESLPHVVRDDTRNWLRSWHEDNKTILLPTSNTPETKPAAISTTAAPASPNPPRHMIITVSVPETHIVHTASLSPSSFTSLSSSSSSHNSPSHPQTIATTGQPLPTTLTITHTRQWASPSSLMALANIPSPSAAIDFIYTIEANPDVWLVAGQRRAQFSATENEVYKAEIVLVPLRSGLALLPGVDVKAKIMPRKDKEREGEGKGGGNERGNGDGGEELNCETDLLSYGECVMVVPDVRSSTIGIGDMGVGLGPGRSTVWLESVGR